MLTDPPQASDDRPDAPGAPDPADAPTLAALVRAHEEVLGAEERARHPQAGPLAQPRLAAAKRVERDLLDRLGFETYAEATFLAFRSRLEGTHKQPDEPSDEGSERADVVEAAGAAGAGGADGVDSVGPSEPAADPEPDALVSRLEAMATEYADAERRHAQERAAAIIEAARVDAGTTAALGEKLRDNAAAALAAAAADLDGLLGLIGHVMAKLASVDGDVHGRVRLIHEALEALAGRAGDPARPSPPA